MIGVYLLTNLVNGKVYVGQSINIEGRWKDHFHYHRAPKCLQAAIDKYGADNFKKEVLQECLRDELDEYEIFYIAKYRSSEKEIGYNRCPGGSTNRGFKWDMEKYHPPMTGKRHSEETKEKMRRSHKDQSGEKSYWYGKSGPGVTNYGNHHTEETKERIRRSMPDRTGDNNPMRGKNAFEGKTPEEMKEIGEKISTRVSEARKKKFQEDPEFSKRMAEVRAEWMSRPEVRKKMSESAKARGNCGWGKQDKTGEKNPMYHHVYTKESIEKMKTAAKKRNTGRTWWTDGEVSKFCKDPPPGFRLGRVPKH
jgi:group I intron endonuclease